MDQYNSLNGEKLFQTAGQSSLPNNNSYTSNSMYNNTGMLNNIPHAWNAKIAAALVKAQSEMGNATKESKNPFFKSSYANLNSIREAVLPALNKHGIAVLQPINGDVVTTTLLHESGEQISSDTRIVCAKQNDPQAYGSAVSYARRYGLQSMVCIGAEDDDGEKAVVRETNQTKYDPTKPAVKAETVADRVAVAEEKMKKGEITTTTEYFAVEQVDKGTVTLPSETLTNTAPAKRGWAGKKSTKTETATPAAKGDLF